MPRRLLRKCPTMMEAEFSAPLLIKVLRAMWVWGWFPSPAPHRIYPFMKLTVNGKAHECPFETTVSALLEQLALTGRRVAVERNGDIVPRSQHAETVLAEGDQIEIVVAVGGG